MGIFAVIRVMPYLNLLNFTGYVDSPHHPLFSLLGVQGTEILKERGKERGSVNISAM